MKFILYILFFFPVISIFASDNNCLCGKEEKANNFLFSNGRSIVVCSSLAKGNRGIKDYGIIILEANTGNVIDELFSSENFKMKMSKDTLFVFEQRSLASGKNRKARKELWHIFEFYFIDSVLVEDVKINQRLNFYSKEEMMQTVTEYKNADSVLTHGKIEIASKLVMAGISGDTLAKTLLNDFRRKYTLDSNFTDEYIVLKKTIDEWYNRGDTTFKIADSLDFSYKIVSIQSAGNHYGWFGCFHGDGSSAYIKTSILQYSADRTLVAKSESREHRRGCQGGIDYLKTFLYDSAGTCAVILIDRKSKIFTKYYFNNKNQLVRVEKLTYNEANKQGRID